MLNRRYYKMQHNFSTGLFADIERTDDESHTLQMRC